MVQTLTEAIPHGHQLIGSTRSAFEYLISKKYHRQDALYRLNYSKSSRSTDRYRLVRNTISENCMRDRLETCGFVEILPGIWTKQTPSVTSHLHDSPNG